MKIFSIVSLVLLSLVATIVLADSQPNLLVSKSVLSRIPTSNSDLVVSIRIFNIGDGVAYDVSSSDKTWEDSQFSVELGSLDAKWSRIEPGHNVTHTFALKAPKPGLFNNTASVVKYSGKNGEVFTTTSTDLVKVQIWRANEAIRRSAPHYRVWGTFLGFVLAVISLPLVSYLSIRSRYINGVPKELLLKQKQK